ncbi:ABC transporter substrate-binding protein [Paracidovorax citrulli]|uniref:Amino acid ABC transporter substrate-binding protein, PAAT family n=2 Tax=Paracidovorax citrulli TaxID=80869 RepID=A1TR16_PARC0|nr:ABC transporter substrate-binding protein [Paracidovorax citrulli]ABM33404.1 amino acid ABC transporter substrate-binding protein, PAAT family [Paracidovorax citrulli AAC00-1]ATG92678.1 ABC transporter substrate-binding protein [Paracidovorax citrulli]MVT28850.1 transporter substrate-binding domain-containing protein [Paracidovorax citrulli]PVY62798.1 amino acid ABC transporter substrate-binding protein (PAAT family) [Paracidovorax citrulli]REG68217.1 amino acid ABC transporter substrate-bi
MPSSISPDLIAALAPTGRLRASINLGNPLLAHRKVDGEPDGVSVDLARAFALQLGVEPEWLVLDKAAESVQAVRQGHADIGFFAVDPLRGEGIAFTAPYVLIEGAYLVRDGSPITDNAQVDQAGTTVAVGQGSAYDLFLTRELKAARIVRAANSQAVVETFLAQSLDVAAGVRQQLEADMRRHAGLRLLPGRFMVIQQAMGLPGDRPEAAVQCLRDFVEAMKVRGFVAEALERHGVQGASVAPAAAAT